MEFSTPLVPARLLRRYKRFLADAVLEDGREITAHCANPGAMLGLKDPGLRIWLEPNDDPKRKLKYSWKLAELPGGHFAGIDTSLPNRLVKDALAAKAIAELAAYDQIRPEVKYGTGSRVDFLCTQPGLPDLYLEVKNAHLRRDSSAAEFPDCVTARGAKHLGELVQMRAQGHRAVLLYLVQRSDCDRLKIAHDLDPAYGAACQAAAAAGVEMLAYGTHISPKGIAVAGPLPVSTAP
ncbi:MAG: DNA/RNA nuclease SfsA [Mangrovicoccus sp.]|nr:DNA/RNA nuclease SfsA [Mangrovicoccus sp.]